MLVLITAISVFKKVIFFLFQPILLKFVFIKDLQMIQMYVFYFCLFWAVCTFWVLVKELGMEVVFT